MPFASTPTRSQDDLAEFFTTNLKHRIESDRSLAHDYVVRRSDDTFNITEQIIRDLYEADIVLCDLSGHSANPNVMYELGVRLSITNKPVILFREASSDNRRIFDIQGFYAFEYNPTRYRELEDYVVAKIKKFESGNEVYESPVQRVIRDLPSVLDRLKRDRLLAMLNLIATSIETAVITFELAADDLLERAGIKLEPGESSTEHFVKTPERFALVEWNDLRVRPRAVPALHAFLSEPLLDGVLPPAQVTTITEGVADYYTRHFADESVWDHPTFKYFRYFLAESEAIQAGFRFLGQALRHDDDASKLRWALDLFESPVKALERLYAAPDRVVLDERR